jgi:hypothetical protein
VFERSKDAEQGPAIADRLESLDPVLRSGDTAYSRIMRICSGIVFWSCVKTRAYSPTRNSSGFFRADQTPSRIWSSQMPVPHGRTGEFSAIVDSLRRSRRHLRQRPPVVPRHPLSRMCSYFGPMPLQLCQIVKGIGCIEFACVG